MTWLLRVLLLVMAFFLIRKVVAYMFGGWSSSTRQKEAKRAPSGSKAIRGQMVKDPHCGMYVASSLALSLESGEEKLYFCSEECKDTYLRERKLKESSRS